MAVVALVACAAGGLETLTNGLVRPLVGLGHEVALTATPNAYRWLRESGYDQEIGELTGYSVRSNPRLPGERSPHPVPDVVVCAPASANTVAKVALGIADNQALTLLCENVAITPMVVFPRINAAHTRQPAWHGHVQALTAVGVRLIYGPEVWPIFEPRQAPSDRAMPWPEILRVITESIAD